MLAEIFYMWLLASFATCIWPFVLLVCGIERPGLLIAILPVFLPLLAIFAIPALALRVIQLIGEVGTTMPQRKFA